MKEDSLKSGLNLEDVQKWSAHFFHWSIAMSIIFCNPLAHARGAAAPSRWCHVLCMRCCVGL